MSSSKVLHDVSQDNVIMIILILYIGFTAHGK